MNTIYKFTIYFVLLLLIHNKIDASSVSIGYSPIIYYTAFSFDAQNAIDINYRHALSNNLDCIVGSRLDLQKRNPEIYLRLVSFASEKFWKPQLGLEFGITDRAQFSSNQLLLKETRTAMEKSISPMYMAVQSSPLFFVIKEWEISLSEIHVGTHLSHIGRTMRLQIGLLSVGKEI